MQSNLCQYFRNRNRNPIQSRVSGAMQEDRQAAVWNPVEDKPTSTDPVTHVLLSFCCSPEWSLRLWEADPRQTSLHGLVHLQPIYYCPFRVLGLEAPPSPHSIARSDCFSLSSFLPWWCPVTVPITDEFVVLIVLPDHNNWEILLNFCLIISLS